MPRNEAPAAGLGRNQARVTLPGAAVVPENTTDQNAVHAPRTFRKGRPSVTNEPTPDTTTDKPTQPSDAASVERNKAVSRRWIEVFNERDDAGEADLRAQDYVAYAPVSLEPPAGLRSMDPVSFRLRRGFPGPSHHRGGRGGRRRPGRTTGPLRRHPHGRVPRAPAYRRKVTFSGLELNRFVDGRVAEHWFQMDSLTLLQQLGLVVVPGPRLLPRVLAHQLKKLRTKG
jgi:hypothetical protein